LSYDVENNTSTDMTSGTSTNWLLIKINILKYLFAFNYFTLTEVFIDKVWYC
jgi:hypothetical protein